MGRRPSSTARDKRAMAKEAGGRNSARRVAPLYKRLPHGPHRMQREEVVLNQRARIHGALIEAVAHDGYEGTTVKQVIELAGVSRRSFYEQFANKEECFLVTFDLIVKRDLQQLRRAYLAADGPFEQRARAAFERFARIAEEDRKASILVVLEAQRAGVAALLSMRNAACACEQLLARALAESPGANPLPLPIVRAVAGGLHGIAATFLRNPDVSRDSDLAEEMLRWTLVFETPATQNLAERMAAEVTARMREISSTYGRGPHGAEAPSHDEATRLLQGMLRLLARENYCTLTPPQIAEEANVSIDAFCALFVDKQDCLLAAIDMIGDELLAIAADPDLVSEDSARAVRRVLAELMRYLADHPLQTRVLAQEALFTVQRCVPADRRSRVCRRDAAHRGSTRRRRAARSRPTPSPARSGTRSAARSQAGESSCFPPSQTTSAMSCSRRSSGPTPPSRSSSRSARRARLASATTFHPFREVREHAPHHQRDADHDDQRRLARAEDPMNLHLIQVHDREHDRERSEDEQRDRARHLPAVAAAPAPESTLTVALWRFLG